MEAASASPAAGASTPRPWWSLTGICVVTALVWVTASDISIALPTIGADFGGDNADKLQWAVNGYFLAGSLIIVTGRLGDVFGRRRMFAVGTLLIIAGSVVAGLAQGPELLIAGRIIEGVGAAAVLPNALAIVAVSFPGANRDKAIGTWVAVCWGAQAVGPLVGGALIEAFSWQAIFWVNLPLALGALLLVWRTTAESVDQDNGRSVDVPGAIAIFAGLALLNYALVDSDTAAGGTLAVLFVAAFALLGLFVLIESRTKVPLVKLSIFRRGAFDGAVLANLLSNFVFGAVVFFMALYLQVVLQYSPLTAGALLLPATVPILLVTPIGAALGRRYGPWLPVSVSLVVIAASSAFFTTLGGGYGQLLVPFVLLGIGVGLQITMTARVSVDDAGDAGEGVASGVYKASSMIGGSLGVATLTAVFQHSSDSKVRELVAGAGPRLLADMKDVLTGAKSITELRLPGGIRAQETIDAVFDYALANAMWVAAAISLAGAVACFFLMRRYRLEATVIPDTQG
ncbi:MAG: MFS transporter [Solirubrobacterales bacterium]